MKVRVRRSTSYFLIFLFLIAVIVLSAFSLLSWYATGLIWLVSIILTGIFRNNERRHKWLTGKRGIGFVLLSMFVVAFFTALVVVPLDWYYKPSQISDRVQVYGKNVSYVVNWTIANECHCIGPTSLYPIDMYFYADLSFNASGGLSVGNPINYSITIHDISFYVPSNKTTLSNVKSSDYVCCVLLSNSVYQKNNSYATFFLTQKAVKGVSGDNQTGYYATGTIKFIASGMTYLYLGAAAVGSTYVLENSNLSNPYSTNPTPIINIQPISDTFAIQSYQYLVKLAWVIGTFSILLLQPVFEAIIIPEDKPKNPKKPSVDDRVFQLVYNIPIDAHGESSTKEKQDITDQRKN